MPEKRRKSRKQKKPSPLAEFRQQLDALKADPTPSQVRLRADLARDSIEELFAKMREQLRRQAARTRKLEKQSEKWRGRLKDLLHDLSTGPVILPSASGRPAATHERLTAAFQQFETQDFLDLAQLLHEEAGTGETPAYQRFLVDEILVKGSRIVAEHLVRQASRASTSGDEQEFLDRLRHHIAGNVCQGLARQTGYQVTPEVGERIDSLITAVASFLEDLLTATPPGRLIVPHDDSPFDPDLQEPISGRPSRGELKVTATLFPGYLILDNPPRLVARAVVYTDHVIEEEAE